MSGSRKFPPGEHNNWGGGVRGIILFSRYGRGSEAHFREFHYDFNKFEFSGRGSDPPPPYSSRSIRAYEIYEFYMLTCIGAINYGETRACSVYSNRKKQCKLRVSVCTHSWTRLCTFLKFLFLPDWLKIPPYLLINELWLHTVWFHSWCGVSAVVYMFVLIFMTSLHTEQHAGHKHVCSLTPGY